MPIDEKCKGLAMDKYSNPIKFRCREIAVLGREAAEYREISRLLPREAVRHAQCRDSGATWYQHRQKFQLTLNDEDVLLLAFLAGLAVCRVRRWVNDCAAWEQLSFGAFAAICERYEVWSLLPGNPVVRFAVSWRRLVVHLRSLRKGRRSRKSDLITVPMATMFEGVLREASLQTEFMRMIHDYSSPQEVPEATRQRIAMEAARFANAKLDIVDQAVFGGITPHAPAVFDSLVNYWQEFGVETLVARDALDDFQPDMMAN